MFRKLTVLGFLVSGAATLQGVEPPRQGAVCPHLSPAMQAFAAQLSQEHQEVFCRTFSDAERKRAMKLADTEDQFGDPLMTPDQAVHRVMEDLPAGKS
jgi:hypothetical protein